MSDGEAWMEGSADEMVVFLSERSSIGSEWRRLLDAFTDLRQDLQPWLWAELRCPTWSYPTNWTATRTRRRLRKIFPFSSRVPAEAWPGSINGGWKIAHISGSLSVWNLPLFNTPFLLWCFRCVSWIHLMQDGCWGTFKLFPFLGGEKSETLKIGVSGERARYLGDRAAWRLAG